MPDARAKDLIQLGKPSITDEEVKAAERVLRSGWLVAGPEGRAFEEELAAASGKRHAAVLSSGTAALHLALAALFPKGAEAERGPLLVPAFTFPATANVARFVGVPVCLVDVDAQTFCAREDRVRRWVSEKGGAAMVVHQFGYPAPLPPDDGHGVVISDAACAVGAKAAMAGRCACLSFHPRKILTTGEGGAVLSDDGALIEEIRALRAHGLRARPEQEVMELSAPGLNYRLSEFAAAIGRVQLRRLPFLIEAHRERAMRYRERLLPRLPMQADAPGRVWQTVAVVLPEGTDRQALRRVLREGGIETQIASYGLHRLAAFRDALIYSGSDGDGASQKEHDGEVGLPVAEMLHARALALPLHVQMTLSQVDQVCDALLTQLDREAPRSIDAHQTSR